MEGNVWIARLQCDRELHKNVTHISIQSKYRRGIADLGECFKYGLYTRGAVSAVGEDFAIRFHIHFACGAYPTF
jgi:hypothetical protein